ncbi:MAG: VOC family protein [Promethearchaeota archaeon]
MQKIIPNLWFDDQAEEAVKFYISLFKNSQMRDISRYGEAGAEVSGRPIGSVMTIDFILDGQEFTALNGGPIFKFSPAISFFVNCETQKEFDNLWNALSNGGKILMEKGTYPFSEKFGWLNDKYGVSWQLNLGPREKKITPFLMFIGDQHGRAEEAIKLYTSLIKNSRIINIIRYGEEEAELEGTVNHAIFTLDGQEFMAIDSSIEHPFTFTHGISFMVNCETQEEVDELWSKLSENGEKEPCGWLKDKFGISWQIIPTLLGELLKDPNPEKTKNVMEAMLKMGKIEIKKLKKAYEQG